MSSTGSRSETLQRFVMDQKGEAIMNSTRYPTPGPAHGDAETSSIDAGVLGTSSTPRLNAGDPDRIIGRGLLGRKGKAFETCIATRGSRRSAAGHLDDAIDWCIAEQIQPRAGHPREDDCAAGIPRSAGPPHHRRLQPQRRRSSSNLLIKAVKRSGRQDYSLTSTTTGSRIAPHRRAATMIQTSTQRLRESTNPPSQVGRVGHL